MKQETDEPATVEPPFTATSPETVLVGVPIGIVMLITGAALRVNIASFRSFLFVCIIAGGVSSAILSRRTWLEKLSGNQRTLLEALMLLGSASLVCFLLLKIFLEGRTD
jgi:hypothetical protein